MHSAIYDEELLSVVRKEEPELNELPDNFVVRPLRSTDFDKGYCELLSQLTSIGDMTPKLFKQQFDFMKNCSDTYYVTVIEDTHMSKVIGTISIIKERKFIHCAGARCRIEDVVVDKCYRGKGLAKCLTKLAVCLAKSLHAYKLSLECTEDLIPFYSKYGLDVSKNNYMELRF